MAFVRPPPLRQVLGQQLPLRIPSPVPFSQRPTLPRRRRPMLPAVVVCLPRTDAEWRDRLPPSAYEVLRRGRTEPPGSSPWAASGAAPPGSAFACAGCGVLLFDAASQFDHPYPPAPDGSPGPVGGKWPTFGAPRPGAPVAVRRKDVILFDRLVRQGDVACERCGGHLGDVFWDRQDEGGGEGKDAERWCINGAALRLVPPPAAQAHPPLATDRDVAAAPAKGAPTPAAPALAREDTDGRPAVGG
ncbi:hypothetical protein MMPV_001688 [Pyropia vietnamensis]